MSLSWRRSVSMWLVLAVAMSLALSPAAIAGTHLGTTQRYRPVLTFDAGGADAGTIYGPAGLSVTPTGTAYVTYTNIGLEPGFDSVRVFDAAGTRIDTWGTTGGGVGEFSQAVDLVVGLDGRVYVADAGNDRVQVFAPDGTPLDQWDTQGSAPGAFDGPGGVGIDSSGNIYVAEYGNSRVQAFDADGTYLRSWSTPVAARDVAVDAAGTVCILTSQRVYRYNQSGTLLGSFGDDSTSMWPFGVCSHIVADASGNLIVTDWWNGRVAKWTQSGSLLGAWGWDGGTSLTGEWLPTYFGVAIDAAGTVYTSQMDAREVTAWERADDLTEEEVSGATRYETAVALSRELTATPEYVVIANGEDFPDALSGGPLAHALGAPLLLVKPDSIPSVVRNRLRTGGYTKAYVLGGTSAVSADVVEDIESLGITVEKRLAGVGRYDTARRVALELASLAGGSPDGAFIVRGDEFADSVSVAGVAALLERPILPVKSDDVPGATQSALTALGLDGSDEIIVLGGTVAIEPSVATAVNASSRIGGSDRYDTGKRIAQWARANGMDASDALVATGLDFPDALAAAPVCAAMRAPLLLSGSGQHYRPTASYLGARRSSYDHLIYIGDENTPGMSRRPIGLALCW